MTDSNTDTTNTTNTGTATGTTVVVNSDNIEGKSKDRTRIDNIVSALKAAGYNAIGSGIGPNYHVSDMKNNKNSYIVCIVGGLCAGTINDYGSTYYQNYMKNNNNRGGQAYIWTWGKYKCDLSQISYLERAWDDNFSGSSFKGISKPAEYLKNHNFDYCAAGTESEFITAVVNMVKTGASSSGSSSSGSSTASVAEGFIESGRGSSPQFWNLKNYEAPYEVHFTNFTIKEENPRIKTAEFESPDNIDLTEGRDAVFITGDCNDFGGIILKKSWSESKQLWKYQCQGFMDRIMANEIYMVANGSKTAHTLIKEVLADIGLPDINLLDADEYDVAISEDTQELIEADSDLTETSDLYTSQVEDENNNSSSSSSSSESDGSTTSTSGTSTTKKVVTETLATNSDGTIKNTFKRKPVGIYDCKTTGDFIRTLIFDYGINVDFYGDINGIPHFDILDLETWKHTGWYLAPDMGFEQDYTYDFDITDIITQVGVKNVLAINGNGEIYTSEDLLGVNIENYVGRMGVIVDNPSANGSSSTSSDSNENQVIEKYQDSTGKEYESNTVLTTNGKPSCSNCKKKNGGVQPTYVASKKYWYNKCPGCNTTGKLKDDTDSDKDGVTICSNCNLNFCQYCGYEKKSGNYQLTELFYTKSSTTTNNNSNDNTSSTSGTKKTTDTDNNNDSSG